MGLGKPSWPMGQMDAKAANTCEHPDLRVIDRYWQAKRGWHPARHPCHPLIFLEIYRRSMPSIADSYLADAR